MMLDQITYKEAMSKAELPDETGMRLLEEAYGQKEQRRRRWHVQIAVFAGILIAAVSANGICFASTGQNVWDLFNAVYQSAVDEDVTAIGEEFRECGESVTDGNLKFTLESYWYDKESVEAYLAVRIDSLDGSKLDAKSADGYFVLPETGGCAGSTVSDPVISEDGKSVWTYHHISCAYDIDGKTYDTLRIKFTGNSEERNESWEFGSFVLEPTGTMRVREIDCQALEGCSKASLSGTGVKLFYNKSKEECREPERIETRLADGTVYWLDLRPVPDYGMRLTEELPEHVVTVTGGSIDMREFEEGVVVYFMDFKDFIDIDSVEAVSVNGVELPLK